MEIRELMVNGMSGDTKAVKLLRGNKSVQLWADQQ